MGGARCDSLLVLTAGLMKTLGSGFVSEFSSSFPGVSSFAFGHSSVRL